MSKRDEVISRLDKKIAWEEEYWEGFRQRTNEMIRIREEKDREWQEYIKINPRLNMLEQCKKIFRWITDSFKDTELISKLRKTGMQNALGLYSDNYDENRNIEIGVFIDDGSLYYKFTNCRGPFHGLSTPKQMASELNPKFIYFAHKSITSTVFLDHI